MVLMSKNGRSSEVLRQHKAGTEPPSVRLFLMQAWKTLQNSSIQWIETPTHQKTIIKIIPLLWSLLHRSRVEFVLSRSLTGALSISPRMRKQNVLPAQIRMSKHTAMTLIGRRRFKHEKETISYAFTRTATPN